MITTSVVQTTDRVQTDPANRPTALPQDRNFSSFLKRNLHLCCQRYQSPAHVLLHGHLRPLVFTFAHYSLVNEHQRNRASFVLELLLLLNDTLTNGLQ